MDCFIMKARTLDNKWYSFSLADIPTRFNNNEFALMNKPNTPRLQLAVIRRGCEEFGVFEGDIIVSDGERWLVCYERGFYAINEDRVTRHIYTFKDFQIVDNCFDSEFTIPILMRSKHLFKYRETIFRFEDIVGCYDYQHLILRCCSNPVPWEEIQQECGVTYNGKRLYFGDMVDGSRVCLHGGRVTLFDGSVYKDITTGGNI